MRRLVEELFRRSFAASINWGFAQHPRIFLSQQWLVMNNLNDSLMTRCQAGKRMTEAGPGGEARGRSAPIGAETGFIPCPADRGGDVQRRPSTHQVQ